MLSVIFLILLLYFSISLGAKIRPYSSVLYSKFFLLGGFDVSVYFIIRFNPFPPINDFESNVAFVFIGLAIFSSLSCCIILISSIVVIGSSAIAVMDSSAIAVMDSSAIALMDSSAIAVMDSSAIALMASSSRLFICNLSIFFEGYIIFNANNGFCNIVYPNDSMFSKLGKPSLFVVELFFNSSII